MSFDAPPPMKWIVTNDRPEVACVSHVELKPIATVFKRKVKCRDSILTRILGCATVTEQKWSGR